jgi:hypothetical protein
MEAARSEPAVIGGESRRPGGEHGGRAAEINAALEDVSACIARIHALIPRVYDVIERRTETPRPPSRPRILYGGGPSAFTPRRPAGPELRDEATAPRTDAELHQERAARPIGPELRQEGAAHPLILAADLALAGYSRDQIGERLRALGEAEAARTLGEAFE